MSCGVPRIAAIAHNIGHFRYLECARLAEDGRPVGEITDWDDIRFPFDPNLQDRADIASVAVVRTPGTKSSVIEETYTCDSSGNLAVKIADKATGYDQWYEPESISYKVRADDGNLYILRQKTSMPDGTWELVSFRQQC